MYVLFARAGREAFAQGAWADDTVDQCGQYGQEHAGEDDGGEPRGAETGGG